MSPAARPGPATGGQPAAISVGTGNSMENAVNASTAGSSDQNVTAGAGNARQHAASRLTARLRNHPTMRLLRGALRPDPQDRWAGVFGRIAGYSFAVAVVTGVLLL